MVDITHSILYIAVIPAYTPLGSGKQGFPSSQSYLRQYMIYRRQNGYRQWWNLQVVVGITEREFVTGRDWYASVFYIMFMLTIVQ